MVYMLHILKMNIIAAVMIALAMVFARFVKGKYSSKWKYYMWLAVMIFLLLPFNFSSKSPVKLQIETSETEQQITRITGNAAEIETEEKEIYLYGMLKVMAVVWIAGILFFGTVRGLKYYFSLHSMMRWSYPTDNDRLLELYFYICRKKRIKKPPRLLVCEGLSSPMLAGLRNPGLYVPEESYGLEEMEFILSHELSHYIRKDLWYKMLMIIVTTIYWFNPALYWMQCEAEKDIENLCDGKIAVNYSRQECRRYGELLLKIAASQNQVPYLSVRLSDSKQVFKDRILYMRNLRYLKEKLFPAILLTVTMTASHVLVGISIKEIPIMAENLVDFQAEQTPKDSASGQVVSMVRVSGEHGEIPENIQDPENNRDLENSRDHLTGGAADNHTEQMSVSGEEDIQQEAEAGNEPMPEEGSDESQPEAAQNPVLTDERVTVWGNGGNSAVYVYRAENGDWYDGGGRQFYENGGGEWIEAGTGSVWTEEAPPDPAGDAREEVYVTDQEQFNSQSLYLGGDGVWVNKAGGVYTDNGDGTWTGMDGKIWYQN